MEGVVSECRLREALMPDITVMPEATAEDAILAWFLG